MCCVATGTCGFDQRKAAELALATVRFWQLESNHSSVDRVIFCTHENADYEIHEDLMSTVYFPLSKIQLTDGYMKESSNNDCVVNLKNFEISDEVGQNLSGWQIHPMTESPKESSKIISEKVDFIVVRDPNILLGLINYGENVCFFKSFIQSWYCLPSSRDYVNKLGPPVKGVVMKIRKLFREIETSNQPVRTSNYVRYLSLQGYECGMQYDGHECLLQLLAKSYPSINDDCMFKTDKSESTLCNDCGHTSNNGGVCTDWSLNLENSSNIQTMIEMLHQLIDPMGEYLENYRCADGCQKLNTSTKAVYVTQLSDALIIQPNIFKCSGGISKKVIPNLRIDKEISLWGNRMVLSGVIYHEGEQSHCGHYTSGVKVDNTWFLISDTRILRQRKLQCSSKNSVP